MTHAFHLLADTIPAPLIFFGAVAVIWAIAAVFGKASNGGPQRPVPNDPRRRTPDQRPTAGAPLPRVMLPPQLPTAPQKPPRRAKSRGNAQQQRQNAQQQQQAARQAVAAQRAKAAQQAHAQQQQAAAADAAQPAAVVSQIGPVRSETSRNLRLMLRRGGIRESIVLAEVLGPPKSLRE